MLAAFYPTQRLLSLLPGPGSLLHTRLPLVPSCPLSLSSRWQQHGNVGAREASVCVSACGLCVRARVCEREGEGFTCSKSS